MALGRVRWFPQTLPDPAPGLPCPSALHRAVRVVFPLSLIFIVCGWIWSIIGFLAQNVRLLIFTGCYYLLGGEFEVSGLQSQKESPSMLLGSVCSVTQFPEVVLG